ncbi:hypothetical protein ABZ851_07200 [Streptomyces sp. NPDC047049]|uniref:hypothetical protein n=1 Tax=Streptomyces sp. NPDC047049 TaxID=3156688 RepID=UPI0033C7E8D9
MSKKDKHGRAASAFSKTTGVPYETSRVWAKQGFISLRRPFPKRQDEPSDYVAELRAEATGWPTEECLKWAEQGFISTSLPIPDASSAEQRHLEAFVVHVLAEALRDGQLDSAVFGVTRVRPLPSFPVFYLHAEMANVVVSEVLPRFEAGYGGIKGIPGLRPAPSPEGGLDLRLVGTGARVRFVSERGDWQPTFPANVAPGGTTADREDDQEVRQLWRSEETLDPLEHEELRFWNMEPSSRRRDVIERNWLLSRILRRSALANMTGKSHGWANTYTHAYEDVVMEWCCGEDPRRVMSKFLRSGLTTTPPGMHMRPDPDFKHSETFYFGSGRAYVRRLSGCNISEGVAEKIRASIRERYTR